MCSNVLPSRICICGYHLYQIMWTANVGESWKLLNSSYRYTVVILKDGVVVGHLPRKLSLVFFSFYYETVRMIALWLVEEDILQIYHSKCEKIKCLLCFSLKKENFKKNNVIVQNVYVLKFYSSKLKALQCFSAKIFSIYSILYVYAIWSTILLPMCTLLVYKPQIVYHTSRLLCCLDPDHWVYNSLATAVLHSFES